MGSSSELVHPKELVAIEGLSQERKDDVDSEIICSLPSKFRLFCKPEKKINTESVPRRVLLTPESTYNREESKC